MRQIKFKVKTIKIVLFFCVLTIVLFFGVRSCNSDERLWYGKLYKIARDSSWYPLDLLGKERSLLAFSNELIVAIAKDQSIKVELLSSGSENLFSGLDNKLYDAVLSSLSPTPYNHEFYLFSKPFYPLGPVLVVRSSSTVTNLNEMIGKSIGIPYGSTLIYKEYPAIFITSYDNILNALNDLERNVIDGVILNRLTAYAYTIGLYTGRLKVATMPLTDEGIRLISRNDKESGFLIKKFNEGLQKAQENGTYNELLKRWGLFIP